MQYTVQPKKALIVDLLAVLQKYTDESHRLSQREIADILEREYQMKVDRRAIKRNLVNLMDSGYEIGYSERVRRGRGGEQETLYTDLYLVRDFTEAELRLMIDSLLFSRHIPNRQRRDLIEKIQGLSSRYFRARTAHIRSLPEHSPENRELFLTVEVLDEAISQNKQVQFLYNSCDVDKQLHPRRDRRGQPRRYLVNPYQMVAANGRYYLIGNLDEYDNLANYRLDRITDIRLLDTPSKPPRLVQGLENGLDLPRHMAEHIYMFHGESARVSFRAKRSLVSDILDWFGQEVQFSDVTADKVTAKVSVNLQAMRCWALQYAKDVTLLSPPQLVEQVKKDLAVAIENYGC
ncbi:helix-turn-helix transcriptional regulator [Bittarella massiliensis (ex Durand et al. 2017)]|uniref:helix-turn-helix transcriptional regulator n=1 Tax=Bittarella massiliensis (ex Durand et al. 2017) TaxID=1720313 RepID=UPI001AA0E4D4|nr:WYL domain-containing protein [Bittarella massiliensis (ex Durand et al. 2017)]MBO1678762.1 WYL domain-containing protein [Bittarella massiliensis (ex Durand et al. 2017)]